MITKKYRDLRDRLGTVDVLTWDGVRVFACDNRLAHQDGSAFCIHHNSRTTKQRVHGI